MEVLHDSKYLGGLLVARVLYDSTGKPEKIERYDSAPRQGFPTAVVEAVELEELELDAVDVDITQ